MNNSNYGSKRLPTRQPMGELTQAEHVPVAIEELRAEAVAGMATCGHCWISAELLFHLQAFMDNFFNNKQPRRTILAYDVETLRNAVDWSEADKRGMGVACCGVESVGEASGYHCWICSGERILEPLSGHLCELQARLDSADILVSFGGGDWSAPGFDNEVLLGAGVVVAPNRCLDLRLAIKRATGGTLPKGLTLGLLAQANADPDFPSLGRGKTGDGADAPKLWAEGKRQQVMDYCLEGDVRLVADLTRKLIRDGFLLIPGGERVELPLLVGLWPLNRP